MNRSRFAPSLALVIVLIAGCGGAAVSVAPTATSSSQAVPNPIASDSAANASATNGVAITVRNGEPWVLFAWYLPGKNTKDIFLARPDGTDAHAILTNLPGERGAPAWAPDGSRFAFGTSDAATPLGSIWTANADGSGAALLTGGGGACPDGIAHPSWSPDGSKLSVICYPDPGGQEGSVAIFDPATNKVTRLYTVREPEHLDGCACWSPDGKTLAFTIFHYDPTNQFVDSSLLAVIPAAGGTARRLTTFAMDLSGGSWSPDGSEIALVKNGVGMRHSSDQPSNIYAIKPDGTGLRQITRSSVDGYMRIGAPAWMPDGRLSVVVGTAPKVSGSVPTVNDLRLGYVDPAGGEPVLFPATIHGGTVRPTPTAGP
ncbi:MAG: hypothetical protein ABI553_10890 [Chloroflexota bacterium]